MVMLKRSFISVHLCCQVLDMFAENEIEMHVNSTGINQVFSFPSCIKMRDVFLLVIHSVISSVHSLDGYSHGAHPNQRSKSLAATESDSIPNVEFLDEEIALSEDSHLNVQKRRQNIPDVNIPESASESDVHPQHKFFSRQTQDGLVECHRALRGHFLLSGDFLSDLHRLNLFLCTVQCLNLDGLSL